MVDLKPKLILDNGIKEEKLGKARKIFEEFLKELSMTLYAKEYIEKMELSVTTSLSFAT
jgi:hypothetical protein